MPLQLNVQIDIIIYSFIGGILAGVLFDGYRLIRGEGVPKIISIFEDVLFCIFISIVTFTFLLLTNHAFLDAYVYLFIFLALGIYFKFISPYIITIEKFVGKVLVKSIRVLIKHIIYPFKVFLLKMGNKSN